VPLHYVIATNRVTRKAAKAFANAFVEHVRESLNMEHEDRNVGDEIMTRAFAALRDPLADAIYQAAKDVLAEERERQGEELRLKRRGERP
jgi:hypothetical protein